MRVKFDEFSDAASRVPKMKRSPAGSRASLPSTTLLLSHSEGVTVETAAVASLVQGSRAWTHDIAVDARRLIAICDGFRKLGAKGAEIELAIQGRNLAVTFRTTTVSIPTYPPTR
jgi:hypothetical protein